MGVVDDTDIRLSASIAQPLRQRVQAGLVAATDIIAINVRLVKSPAAIENTAAVSYLRPLTPGPINMHAQFLKIGFSSADDPNVIKIKRIHFVTPTCCRQRALRANVPRPARDGLGRARVEGDFDCMYVAYVHIATWAGHFVVRIGKTALEKCDVPVRAPRTSKRRHADDPNGRAS